MTVGIAAICDGMDKGNGKKIVFCADRQVSTELLQFEGGSSKIEKITVNCYSISSTNDSATSDLILQRTKNRFNPEKTEKIQNVVDALSEECERVKTEELQRDVVSKYQAASDGLKTNPDKFLPFVNDEVRNYYYSLRSTFLVFGLETSDTAHIFTVDQDGKSKLLDNLAFATVGDGGSLALLEITKYPYSPETPAVEAIARVHFAKRLAERAGGVGRDMDLGMLYFPFDNENDKPIPTPEIFDITKLRSDIIEELDNTFTDIGQYERERVREVMPKRLYELLIDQPETKPEEKHKIQ